MVKVTDHHNYLCVFMLPLAFVAYLLVLVLRAGNLLQWTIAAIVSLLSYFALNATWEDTYPTGGVTMLLTCVGIFAALLFLAHVAVGITIIVAMLSIAVPTLQHNADLIANYLGAPQWVAFVILFTGLLLLLLLIYASRIFPLVGLLLKITFTSFFLQVMLRQLFLEDPPDMDRTDMACFTASTDPPGRCSLSFDSYTWMGVLIGLVVIQCTALYMCKCKKKKKKQTQQSYQKVAQPAKKEKEEEEEEDNALF